MNTFSVILIIALVAIAYAIKMLVSNEENDKSTGEPSEHKPSGEVRTSSIETAPTLSHDISNKLPDDNSGDPIFNRDKFLLKQKHLTIGEKYYVYDENKNPLLFIERPAHILRNMGAVIGAIIAWIFSFVIISSTLMQLLRARYDKGEADIPVIFFSLVAATFLAIIIYAYICKIRQVKFFRDDTKAEQLLEIKQDFKFRPLHMSYTVLDKDGEIIARLRKDYIHNILRKKWICKKPDETIWCTILEDSIIQSLLRRILGPLFGLLRTNFIILSGTSQTVIGEFNRKLTLTDQYILDINNDSQRDLDRRVALAIGVLLDTGEKR